MSKMKDQRPTRLEKILAWLMYVDLLFIENGKFNIVDINPDGVTGGTCSYKEGIKSIIHYIPFNLKRIWWNIKWYLRKLFKKNKYPF